jgi:hypothetical protein
MQTRTTRAKRLSASVIAGILGSGRVLDAGAPRCWQLAGTKPANDELGWMRTTVIRCTPAHIYEAEIGTWKALGR